MVGISRKFLTITAGVEVASEGRRYVVTNVMTSSSVLAKDLGTGESKRLRVETLSRILEPDDDQTRAERDLALYTDEEWAEGQRRLEVIKPLLQMPVRSRSDVESIATAAGVHFTTLYKWLKAFLSSGHVSALVPTKSGRRTGTRMLSQDLEEVIRSVIEDKYLSIDRGTAQDVVDEVKKRCKQMKLKAPSHITIRARIKDIPVALALRKRGRRDDARDQYQPIRGSFPGADHPYSVIQIDHTPANVIVVDEVSRLPIGRPYLTLAIDVRSRLVAGLYLSMDPPSAVAVGLCLSQAICQKRDYLINLGVAGDWPAWGVMGKVHCDNAKEFRSRALSRACEDYGIDLQYRMKKTPHYGGHIERLMGTAARIFLGLPGKTFSNPAQRKGYDSDAKAAMTLKELEAYLVDYIVNKYHRNLHTGIQMTPLAAWERGLSGSATEAGIGLLPIPEDPMRVQLDFMPYEERTIQRYGYQLDKVHYYDRVLDRYINSLEPGTKTKQKYLVRRDPRDISVTYFLDPQDNRYTAVPYRNTGFPAISLWELNAANEALKQDGLKDVDEDQIFATVDRLRQRVDDSLNATKKARSARRSAARRPPGTRPTAAVQPERSVPIPAAANEESIHGYNPPRPSRIEDDASDEPITPFQVSLKR
ncbi:urease subunit beta [Stenotrophomonas maltophilia]|uniref:Mu transposase C-terminal domain-containing protein n=1 Tax=Stenotrophomonas maltophilia TaxID=40324 RepID=UPI0015E044A9|nr:Mu transposase C-terminal domain-containing protein [Stenotrophomonas maltophilia]EKT4085287.1 transposase [Stenotrophomonas maltophilia]MBA0369856.1 urease subunit beta [Stenotrophomonas maltophilia]